MPLRARRIGSYSHLVDEKEGTSLGMEITPRES